MNTVLKLSGVCVAILLLASAASAADSLATGKVKHINAEKKEFVLTDAAGKDWTFKLGDKVVINRSGKESLSELAGGDPVCVCYDKGVITWTAKYILVLEGDSKSWELLHGTIKGYEADKKLFNYVDDDGKDRFLAVAGSSRVLIDDKEAKFDDLKIGEHCLMVVSKEGGKMTLKSVVCQRKESKS